MGAHAQNLVGLGAPDLVLRLAALQPALGALTFVIYTPVEGVERRLDIQANIPIERRTVAELLAAKPADRLLDELLGHEERPQRRTIQVDAADLSRERWREMVRALPPGAVLGLCSISTRRGTKQKVHLPMMDFRVPPSEENQAILRKALQRMGLARGALLDSGRSYHFYGFDLLTQEAWWELMARALLIAPLTDVRYIAHRLLEGVAILRLTSTTLKPKVPEVVECL